MKIGVLSDTHNHRLNTLTALDLFKARGITRLLHCGDITNPAMLSVFEGWDIDFVLGNMDDDPAALRSAALLLGLPAPQPASSLTLGGYRVAVMHGHMDEALQNLVSSQEYRCVFHGHTHRRRNEKVGKTRVINPGALGGRQPQTRSIAIVDLAADTVAFVELEAE